jgi:hypothetical protein
MAREFGIREFQFYDWFADYSTPVRDAVWPTPYFRKGEISRQTIAIAIDEIHRQGGRAWAYIQAVGAEEQNLENPARDIWKVRNAQGDWYWHPPNSSAPRFPTYRANAAWAELMVERWAPAVAKLGFDGIHWDTLGAIAGQRDVETAGILEFIKTTARLLPRYRLRQTMNFVDLAWWDRASVRAHLEFPYAEVWSDKTRDRYFAEMNQPDMAGIRGVVAMYANDPAIICARHNEARRHRLEYLTVGDGARRMKTEYWPDTVPLTAGERACLTRTDD